MNCVMLGRHHHNSERVTIKEKWWKEQREVKGQKMEKEVRAELMIRVIQLVEILWNVGLQVCLKQ